MFPPVRLNGWRHSVSRITQVTVHQLLNVWFWILSSSEAFLNKIRTTFFSKFLTALIWHSESSLKSSLSLCTCFSTLPSSSLREKLRLDAETLVINWRSILSEFFSLHQSLGLLIILFRVTCNLSLFQSLSLLPRCWFVLLLLYSQGKAMYGLHAKIF